MQPLSGVAMGILKEQCPKNNRSLVTVTARTGGVHFSSEYETVSDIESLISFNFLFSQVLFPVLNGDGESILIE